MYHPLAAMRKKLMRQSLILLIFLGLISCNGIKKIKEITLVPGYGYIEIEVEKTVIRDILKTYGSNYKVDTFYSNLSNNKIVSDLIKDKNVKRDIYSISYSFDSLGLAFYRRPNHQEIFLISFYEPFKGKTDKGITINQSTILDVIKAYGDTAWEFTDKNIIKSYNGIVFYQDFKDTLPISDDKLLPYLNLKVKEICILKSNKDAQALTCNIAKKGGSGS